MKRVIYEPAQNEIVPDGGVYYTLPVSRKSVVDVLVPDNWATDGVRYYDSQAMIDLAEPFIHHFAGWEV